MGCCRLGTMPWACGGALGLLEDQPFLRVQDRVLVWTQLLVSMGMNINFELCLSVYVRSVSDTVSLLHGLFHSGFFWAYDVLEEGLRFHVVWCLGVLETQCRAIRNKSYLKFLSQCNVACVLVGSLQMNDIWVPKYQGAHTHPPTESGHSPVVPRPEIVQDLHSFRAFGHSRCGQVHSPGNIAWLIF